MKPERSSPLSLPPPATREALRRRLEDFLAKLEKKYGDLRGKIEMTMTPETSLKDMGGLAGPKREIEGLIIALKSPDLHIRWAQSRRMGCSCMAPRALGRPSSAGRWPARPGQRAADRLTPWPRI